MLFFRKITFTGIYSCLQIFTSKSSIAYLNTEKQIIYKKPIVTDITIAKQRIRELLNEKLAFKLEELESDGTGKKLRGVIRIQATSLITQFKIILKECNVEYREILNYTFGIIEKSCGTILDRYAKTDKNEKQLVKVILEILEFIFFIYTAFPRVMPSIRLCRILAIFIFFIRKNDIELNHKERITKLIFDNISFVLDKNKQNEHTQMETLYLLSALAELGSEYQLKQQILCHYFDIQIDKDSGKFFSKISLNYFSITTLLFYIKNDNNYLNLKEFLIKTIEHKFEKNKKTIRKNTELILLLMDILTCPYLQSAFKHKLLKIYGIEDGQTKIIEINKKWFIDWEGFNFGEELDAKRGKEVPPVSYDVSHTSGYGVSKTVIFHSKKSVGRGVQNYACNFSLLNSSLSKEIS